MGDITYLLTDEGLYLVVVIDLYLRMVVGWALAEGMIADLCCQALIMVLEEMHQTVFEYIEIDYNRNRRRANGYTSPKAFVAQAVA
jgi:hypothetical protein